MAYRNLVFFIVCFVLSTSLMRVPSYALTMGVVEYECPLGGGKFEAKVVASYTRFGHRLDMKPLGALVAPIPLAVCPENGFIMYQEKFSPEEVSKLKPFILSSPYQKLRKGNTPYFLLAKIMEFQKLSPMDIAYAYLQASWEVEEGDRKRYETYLRHTIAALRKVLEQTDKNADQEFTARFAIVELTRLLGNFSDAEKELVDLEKSMKIKGFQKDLVSQERALIENKNSTPQEVNFKKNK